VLGITVVALPLLAGCGAGPQQSVTCYGNGTHSLAADDACRRAALIALRQAPRGEVLAAAAEVWQGSCFPGAFCGIRLQPEAPAWNAIVGLRTAGNATTLAQVIDLAWSPPVVPVGGIDPERFIDMILGTRGAWVVTVPKA
jgi:hypothetical protein